MRATIILVAGDEQAVAARLGDDPQLDLVDGGALLLRRALHLARAQPARGVEQVRDHVLISSTEACSSTRWWMMGVGWPGRQVDELDELPGAPHVRAEAGDDQLVGVLHVPHLLDGAVEHVLQRRELVARVDVVQRDAW
jgi:hypothetical protein